ncbi:enolase C-terminal domain-like protein [Enterobacter mori]
MFNSIWDCKQLIEEQLIDYIRTTITHAGGITGMRRIADFASLYGAHRLARTVRSVAHLSRCRAAFRPVGAEFRRAGIHGLLRTDAGRLPHSWRFDNGYMHPGDKPGLGIEFDEKLAAKYPYDPAYLPVARLEDGTLWNW